MLCWTICKGIWNCAYKDYRWRGILSSARSCTTMYSGQCCSGARLPIMLSLALLFTFMADTILVWTEWTVAGVYIFCFAQFMHLLRLCKAKFEYIFAWAAFISVVFAFAIIQGCKPIYAIASVYGLVLFSNLYFATNRFLSHKNDFRSRCAFYGFVAFVCCDFCVATRFLALDGYLTLNVLPIVNFLIWIFYYPSQVLIANSSTMHPSERLAKNLRK